MKYNVLKGAAVVAMVAGLMGAVTPAFSSEILGNWTTESGETASIESCGALFCITLKTGDYAGSAIGNLVADGAKFTGTIMDPADGKEYAGSATIDGATMQLKGCAMVVFCRTQNWQRQ